MKTAFEPKQAPAKWLEILNEALEKPGELAKCFSFFHNYSVGNQLAIMWQCHAKNLPLGPVGTFYKWRELGRNVNAGQKALFMFRPYVKKIQREDDPDNPKILTYFNWENRWFVYAQTNGKELTSEDFSTPEWNAEKALSELQIKRVPYQMIDGNCQGYAQFDTIAINPIASHPIKTQFHEIAHVALGHTEEDKFIDDEIGRMPRNLKEVEAESVAYLCCSLLGITEDLAESRGYIQHWLSNEKIDEIVIAHIFRITDMILKAGMPKNEKAETDK